MITVTSAAPRKTIAKYVVGRGIKKVKLYDVMTTCCGGARINTGPHGEGFLACSAARVVLCLCAIWVCRLSRNAAEFGRRVSQLHRGDHGRDHQIP